MARNARPPPSSRRAGNSGRESTTKDARQRLERHVVVRDARAEIVGRRGAGGRGALGARPGGGSAGAAFLPLFGTRRLAARAALAAGQDDVIHDDFRGVSFLAILVVPTAGSEAAFDVDLLALGQIRGQVLIAPQGDIVPVGLIFPIAGLRVLDAPVGGQGETRDRNSARRVPGFGIPAQVAQEDYFVDATACHTSEA